MRAVLIIFCIYPFLLWGFLNIRADHLKTALNETIARSTELLIAQRMIDHRHTLFAGVLIDEILQTSPLYVQNQTRPESLYELVIMSPCNPRIQSCS